MAKAKKPVGRPSIYSAKLAARICEEIALGYSLRAVCKAEDMPSMATVFTWLRTKPDFLEQYEKATAERTEAMAEDLLDIADDGTNDYYEKERPDGTTFTALNGENIQRSRLRVDTRKWLMSKMKPKKYGEKLDLTTDGKPLLIGLAEEEDEA